MAPYNRRFIGLERDSGTHVQKTGRKTILSKAMLPKWAGRFVGPKGTFRSRGGLGIWRQKGQRRRSIGGGDVRQARLAYLRNMPTALQKNRQDSYGVGQGNSRRQLVQPKEADTFQAAARAGRLRPPRISFDSDGRAGADAYPIKATTCV